jgi:pimeloyl-ACP methyl ester carboxylesterase
MVVAKAMARNAADEVQAGGLTFRFRKALPSTPARGAPPVVLLHGVGSSGFEYRRLVGELADAHGLEAYAPDLLGHGGSSKPSSGYDRAAYMSSLDALLGDGGILGPAGGSRPLSLVVHGYVLGQYALLWAAANEDRIASLVVLPTPLSLRSKLPPALAAYTSPVPFLRPKAGTTFDAAAWIASGSAYVLGKDEAASYRAPYESDPATSAALAATLEAVGDWKTLLRDVDEAMRTFRARALVVPGSADPFSDLKSTFEWLESKRTTMRLENLEGRAGHWPQEDFPEPVASLLGRFVTNEWTPRPQA